MSTTFADLGVPDALARSLATRGIDAPFPIQAATIPDALAGRDLCGKAPTGSGKTIAFGIPLVLGVTRAAPKRPKGLVLTPTRELALQVAEELRSLGPDLRVLAVYGGAGIEPQLKALRHGVDIVVACPGRLLDVIDRKACDLRDVAFVVVDEADRMADMGFLPDVRRLLDRTADRRQTLLFSATLDGAVDALVKEYQHEPVVHEMAEEASGDITHHLWRVERPHRSQLTAEIVERVGPTVVFSRTRHGADRIARQLERAGVSAAAIHGNRSQGQREKALDAFHRGRVKALVATDVAARGIHVEGVACVVHYDLPADHKDYVHRSGRTGRAGAAGTVVGLVIDGQVRDATKLARQAEVVAEVTDPAVSLLPAGYAAFRPEARATADGRKARPGKAERAAGRDRDARRDRDDAAPSAGAGRRRTEGARPGPRSADRPRSGGAKTSGPKTSGPKTSGPKTSGPRSAASGSKASGPRSAASKPGGPRPVASKPSGPKAAAGAGRSPERAAGADVLERSLGASDKVRPSGASRRKARRQALLAAGVDPASLAKPRRRR